TMILAGLVLLYFGAEGLVRGSASLALRFGMTPLMVGLTIVAFGTSSPELVVSIKAAFNGFGDIAVGNVVGSNIFNIAVILGFAALVRPLKVKDQILRTDTPIMIAVSLLLVLFLRDRMITRPEAAILAAGIIAYMILSVHLSRKEAASADIPAKTGKSLLLDLLFVVGGLGMLIAGSNFLVNGTVKLATYLGVSQAVIGLTIVAAGTSFPELATSVVAGIRGEDDIAIGNIIGSNIFNILCILGVAPFFGQVKTGGIQVLDLAFMLGTSALLLPLMWPKLRIGRAGGMLLVLLYGSYLFLIWPK
ncbi:MAG TPA: calcium/sodium antiporter, partial [Chitinispirillaceae bacterium]|nr:calcium/sodium antiporter [Chitinispirillaceae bacterium]